MFEDPLTRWWRVAAPPLFALALVGTCAAAEQAPKKPVPPRTSTQPQTPGKTGKAPETGKQGKSQPPATDAGKDGKAGKAAPPQPPPPPTAKPGQPQPGTPPKPGAPASAPKAMIANGGFERHSVQENYWDGVVSGDFLGGRRRGTRAVTESSRLGNIDMPMAVNYADLNADGKGDILMADPWGYYFVYFNAGETPGKPAFEQAELVPLYLSTSRYWYQDERREEGRGPRDRWKAQRLQERMCVRPALADWGRTGALDLFVGNFAGEIFFIPNRGNSRAPRFDQPSALPNAIVETDTGGRLWANLLAPAVGSFTAPGRLDLLVGEGSYSANSVHLLMDPSGARPPKFDPARRVYLCYGMGREHLMPTVVDYNEDGFPDVLAGDRNGELTLFLHPGKRWKPGVDLPFSTAVTLGNQARQPGLIAPCAADYDGDGLFDLLLGKANGRVALARNVGRKGVPRFEAPVELKGKDRWGKDVREPSDWRAEPGWDRGNALAVFSVVDETTDPGCAPVEGKCALRGHHMPVVNRVLPFPQGGIAGCETVFDLSQSVTLEVGAPYELEFRTRGNGVHDGKVVFEVLVVHVPKKRVSLGERRAVEHISEFWKYEDEWTASPQWQVVRKRFKFEFKNKVLNEELQSVRVTLRFEASLTFGRGKVYYDDIRLTKTK